jgi:ribA/ribD-fused uncharacterized protein
MHVIPRFEGEWFFLSNFHEAPIKFLMDGEEVVFQTGEAAFQAAKCHALVDPSQKREYVRRVAAAPTPSKAKYEGRSCRIATDKWDHIKVECMREVVFQKFQQNPELRVKLMETGHAMLVESNTWNDRFWGRCDGKGFNILGAILMECRGYWYWQARLNRPEMGS